MPLDNPGVMGTERDGSKSKDYCAYCYQNGAFVNPNTTIDEMKTIVKTEMEKRNISTEIINTAVNTLPQLKRWRMAVSQ